MSIYNSLYPAKDVRMMENLRDIATIIIFTIKKKGEEKTLPILILTYRSA